MDLRQLNAVVAVADHGSFSAAADALHTVQSNVSTHVARLERELGAPLIDRTNGCRLTEEGQAVVERARRVAAELDALVSDVAALRNEVRGSVSLGVIGTTARWLVARLLSAMDERHPNVHMTIVDATSTSLEPRLAAGELDLGVVNMPAPGDDLVCRALFEEDLVLVVNADHPWAERGEVDISETGGMQLLLPATGTALRTEIDHAAEKAGVHWTSKAELDGVRLIASLTFEGHGPAVLPATAVPEWLKGNWRVLMVRGLGRRTVGLALRRRGRPAAPVRALMQVLDDVIAKGTTELPGLHPPSS